MSVQDLRPTSQDTSAFYLANIYQVLADPGSSTANSTANGPPEFSPPRYAIWVNSLWVMSLVISLSCSLFATLLQQWARRYVEITQPARCRPEKRARIREFFANGVDKMRVPLVVEILFALLHLSLFLFFSGLVILFFNISRSIFALVLFYVALFSTIYGCTTVMPVLFPRSPYYSPLSSSAWKLYIYIKHRLLSVFVFAANRLGYYDTYFDYREERDHYRRSVSVGIWKLIEETALELSPEIDVQILDWTLGAPADENILEKYFGTIPDFVNSKLVDSGFTLGYPKRFWEWFCGFLGRTLSVDPVNEALKARRLVKCINVMDVLPCPSHVSALIYGITDDRLGQVPLSVETGHTLARRFSNNNGRYGYQYAQYCVARILVAEHHDDRWFALASSQLGLSKPDLEKLDNHGDSLMLAVLLHVIRRTKSSNWESLSTFTQFDIRDTLPELQHEFCALWNKMVQQASQDANHSDVDRSLHETRHLYIALHQNIDAAPTASRDATSDVGPVLSQPSSYPSCIIASHGPVTNPIELSPIPGPSVLSPSSSTSQPISTEATIVPTLSSSLGYASRSQGPRSPSPNIVPAHIPTEETSVTAISVPENTETISIS